MSDSRRSSIQEPVLGFSTNSELSNKLKKAVGRLSENMHIIANEPSLALFCLQEHVRKEVPLIIEEEARFGTQHRTLQGTCYDIDYSIGAIKSIEKSVEQFNSIQDHLKNTLFLKQQLRFEQARRKQQQQQQALLQQQQAQLQQSTSSAGAPGSATTATAPRK